MKILMLVNWKIEYCDTMPDDKQPPDYYVKNEDYWFYRYFKEKPDVDVIDIHTFPWLEKFEKEKIKFYIIQAFRCFPKLNQYDLIVSHGMQSGVVVSLWRRFFKGKAKHIVFDIGSFASASESGSELKLMQFASKSIDGVIYHTSSQIMYYQKCFPWLVDKAKFIRFGTDSVFFGTKNKENEKKNDHKYIICVGYIKRDWETLVEAYKKINSDVTLRLVGYTEKKYEYIKGIEQIPFIPIKELIEQIKCAIFCVLPLQNYNYSFGQMTLLQQMALGKCVVASRSLSLIDYAIDQENIIFYKSGDITDCAEKIDYCLKNEHEREKIGNRAQQYIKNQLNEKIMAEQIEAYYQYILEKK